MPNVDLGIRNVRRRPERFREVVVNHMAAPILRQPKLAVTYVPGGYVNPNVQNWYYEKAFEHKPKRSWASQAYPELFGPDGIYPLAYEEGCDPECMLIDGECRC